MDKTIQIDTFSRITQVSRETITSLKKYEDTLIKTNKTLNLVGNSTIHEIWTRHFLDNQYNDRLSQVALLLFLML